MASLLAKIWSKLHSKQVPLSIMIVGLDNSGKTSILKCLTSATPSCSRLQPPTPREEETGKFEPQDSTEQDESNSLIDQYNDDSPRDSCGANLKSTNGSSTSNNMTPNIMPTIGYNFERIQFKNLTLTVLDFSGQNKYRGLWQEFYAGVDAIVFVIDSSDLIRLVVVRDELENMLNHPFFATLTSADNTNKDGSTTNSEQQHSISSDNTIRSPSSSVNFNSASSMLAQKQLTVSQGKLIQTPLDTANQQQRQSMSRSSSTTTSSSRRASSSPIITNKSLLGPSTGGARPTQYRRTKVPILFLANKSDLPNSVSTEVVIKALNLNQLSVDRHPWFIQATSVNSSQTIVMALDWLTSQLLSIRMMKTNA